MSETKKPAAKRIIDVAHPGKSAPAATSKPVLVTNRPILKDPMMVDETEQTDQKTPEKVAAKTSTSEAVIEPIGAPPLERDAPKTKSETVKGEEEAEPAAEAIGLPKAAPDASQVATAEIAEPKTEKTTAQSKTISEDAPEITAKVGNDTTAAKEAASASDTAAQTQKKLEAEDAARSAHDVAVQKLIDSKQYFLPINAVEKRKTKRFVVLGILLSVILALAWADIALDAGLIQINNVKPLTHFFSN